MSIKQVPQVALDDIEATIASEHYYTAADGVNGVMSREAARGNFIDMIIPPALDGLIHCVLTTKNGHIVTGEAYCADLTKPDPVRGRAAARRRAIDKLWDMVIYAERERLATIQPFDASARG